MSDPVQWCALCGGAVDVHPDGRGLPPRIAENKLRKACAARGCPCEPHYQAGISPALTEVLRTAAAHVRSQRPSAEEVERA